MSRPFIFIFSVLGVSALSTEARAEAPEIEAIQCRKSKSNLEFITSITRDMIGRTPTPEEITAAASRGFDREEYVNRTLDDPDIANGISRFVTRLFALDTSAMGETALAADLLQEPIVLVLRNLQKPWKELFATRDVFCTQRTAALYDYPVYDVQGFVSCQLPPERAGFLGLASVLTSTSSAFYLTNNNYKRAALALFLATGKKLEADTNGDAGEGPGKPLAACVPTTDMRIDQGGLVYGSAAIPLQGANCSTCHSTHLGPVSVAFRRFGPKGELLDFAAIDRLNPSETQGHAQDYLKVILREQDTCWSPDPELPPLRLSGIPGLGRVIARSPNLWRALGRQIPPNLANVEADGNMITTIGKHYLEGGETLLAAIKGFLVSDSYQCEERTQ
jgi:hypothetical protein